MWLQGNLHTPFQAEAVTVLHTYYQQGLVEGCKICMDTVRDHLQELNLYFRHKPYCYTQDSIHHLGCPCLEYKVTVT